MDSSPRVVVLGGGIAGLATTCALARTGARVLLIEREATLCAHSSGRNAAIFRTLDASPGGLAFAVRSAELFDQLLGGRQGWLRQTGVLYVSRGAEPLAQLVALAVAHRLPHELLEREALLKAASSLEGGEVTHGLRCPMEGVMDIHAIQQALIWAVRQAGAVVRCSCPAVRVLRDHQAVTGVELDSGEVLPAQAVVIAAGAWAEEVGTTLGMPLPLLPLRRHLAILEPQEPTPAGAPVVWAVDDEVYFRPESGGVLACPCDEAPCPPGVPQPTFEAMVSLGMKLDRTAPRLASCTVRRSWAGLRTFAPDRAMVVGEDPRLTGLFWLAGLGGHGMSAGMAAGELLACVFNGRPHPLEAALSPARCVRALEDPAFD